MVMDGCRGARLYGGAVHLEVELVGVLCGSFLLQRLQSLLFGIEILGTKHIVLQQERHNVMSNSARRSKVQPCASPAGRGARAPRAGAVLCASCAWRHCARWTFVCNNAMQQKLCFVER